METNKSKIAIGCMVPIVIFLVLWIGASVYNNYNDERTKEEIMKMSETEAQLKFPNATDIMAYNVEFSKGVETFSSLGTDRAIIHVSMKINSNEVKKYFWWNRLKGEKDWILTDIRE